MNILVITPGGMLPSPHRPHAGIFFANLLARVKPAGGRLIAVAPAIYVPRLLLATARFRRHAFPLRHVWSGIEILHPRFPYLRQSRRPWLQSRLVSWSALPLCRALHRRHRFDIVLGYGLDQAAQAAHLAARELGLPCVCWGIGSDVHTLPLVSPEHVKLLRHNVRHIDLVLTESDALRRMLSVLCPGCGHVHTFYKGIDLADLPERDDRASLREKLHMRPDGKYMVSAGRVRDAKGAWEFYEAFKRLSRRRGDLSALWVGDGDLTQRLRATAARDGLGARFTITGFLPRPRALEHIKATDVLAFASHAEGLPNVIMEGMAAGLPIVATDFDGVRELIADQTTGLIAPLRNADALAAAIESVLREPDRAAEMARRGRDFVLKYFDVDRNAPVLMSILEGLLGGRAPAEPIPPCAGVQPGHLPMETLV